MTTEDSTPDTKVRAERLNANLAKVDELSKRLTAALAHRRQVDPALHGPAPDVYMKAAAAYFAEMMANPAKVVEHQINYWGKTLKHYVEAQQTLAKGEFKAPPDPGPKDRRFSNPLWETHPFFNYLKQQYQMNAEAISTAVGDMETLAPEDRRRVEYFTRQIVDMFSPTNFLGTNPDALEKAVETDGESLVQGLENLVRDIESNQGDLLVTLADREAFHVGQNIAATPGEVVYRNRMLELIQYTPTTEKVHKTPLLIFPPWINKFYILDLRPKNSFIRWAVDQGHTVFVASWVNPDEALAEKGFDDYMKEGVLAALDAIEQATGVREVNAIGYCLGGTLLATTLAYMATKRDNRIKSATYFVTMTDFEEAGELGVFIDEEQLKALEEKMGKRGFLDGREMATITDCP